MITPRVARLPGVDPLAGLGRRRPRGPAPARATPSCRPRPPPSFSLLGQQGHLGFQSGFACREQVLDSFVLDEADLAWVRARGEASSRPSAVLEEETDSDASDFV